MSIEKSLSDPFIMGPIMSMIIAVIRVTYDKEETKPSRIFLESLICGLMTWTSGAAVRALGWSEDWVLVAGGVIGFLGAFTVRQMALKYLSKKV